MNVNVEQTATRSVAKNYASINIGGATLFTFTNCGADANFNYDFAGKSELPTLRNNALAAGIFLFTFGGRDCN